MVFQNTSDVLELQKHDSRRHALLLREKARKYHGLLKYLVTFRTGQSIYADSPKITMPVDEFSGAGLLQRPS
jgi:hypothetical protein